MSTLKIIVLILLGCVYFAFMVLPLVMPRWLPGGEYYWPAPALKGFLYDPETLMMRFAILFGILFLILNYLFSSNKERTQRIKAWAKLVLLLAILLSVLIAEVIIGRGVAGEAQGFFMLGTIGYFLILSGLSFAIAATANVISKVGSVFPFLIGTGLSLLYIILGLIEYIVRKNKGTVGMPSLSDQIGDLFYMALILIFPISFLIVFLIKYFILKLRKSKSVQV